MTTPLSRPLRRAVAVVAAACALSLAGTATAHADTWVHTDPAGDVVVFDTETEEETVDPTQERGDVRRVRVTHSDRRVVVRFSTRKALAGDNMVFYGIRTPRAQFGLTRFKSPGTRQVVLNKMGERKPVRCSGIRWDVDAAKATVAVSIPRWCLGRPRWVRAGLGVVTFTEGEGATVDDGMVSGLKEDVRLSPRLYRG